MSSNEKSQYTEIPMTKAAEATVNPVRRIVDSIKVPKQTDPNKKLIPLSIGDPTVFGNLKPLKVLQDKIKELVDDQKSHAYQMSAGSPEAKQAVAQYYTKQFGREIASDHVIIASGCSGAIDIALRAMVSEGDNILVPQPGFSIYETIAKSYGIEVCHYPLIPEKQWQVDLEALEKAINSKTRAIIVNNPSNPCGSVYSEKHLRAIADIARAHALPILADEIYGNMCFDGHVFYPLAKVAPDVPIVHVGGIAKEFLVPGFRLGWVVVCDIPSGCLKNVIQGMRYLSQLLIGANSLVQGVLPAILTPEPGSEQARIIDDFHESTRKALEQNASYLVKRLSNIKGIQIIAPQGAMYLMMHTGKMSDTEFAQRLLDEELVFVLPGSCFRIENYVRLVICAPYDVIEDACARIEAFCKRHNAV